MGKKWKQQIFLGSKITLDGDCSHKIKIWLLFGRKAMTNLDSILRSRHHFANKDTDSQSYGFSSSNVWMWELDHKEGWMWKSWCFWTVVLKKTVGEFLGLQENQISQSKGNQPWIFFGRTDAEDEAPMLWSPDAKNWPIWKDPDAWKDWRQEEKGMTEDEIVGWHHWLNEHKFEQAPGVGDRQGSLMCYSPWVAESQIQLSYWTELMAVWIVT